MESPRSSSVGQAWAERFVKSPLDYRNIHSMAFLRKFIRSPFISLPFRYARLESKSRVLEPGCATGKFSVCFAMLGCSVTALDFSSSMLQKAAYLRRTAEREIGTLDIAFAQGDLENLPLEPNQFDLVINEGVVEHWLDHRERRRVLSNMAQAAKPGGTVAIIVPNGCHPLSTYWIEKSPAFLSSPPMVRYNPQLMRDDLTSIGLTGLGIDGIYAWRWIDQYPAGRVLRLIGGALQRLIPLPQHVRLKWGIHLIGMGRKS